jgi:hypothetical protein
MIGFISVSYTHTLNYTQVQAVLRLQSTVAHALGFPVSTSRLLATAFNTQTVRISHSNYYTQVFSSQKHSSQLTLTTLEDWNQNCHFIQVYWELPGVPPVSRYITSALTAQKTAHGFLIVACRPIAAEMRLFTSALHSNGRVTDHIETVSLCWGLFTKPLLSNALSQSVTICSRVAFNY